MENIQVGDKVIVSTSSAYGGQSRSIRTVDKVTAKQFVVYLGQKFVRFEKTNALIAAANGSPSIKCELATEELLKEVLTENKIKNLLYRSWRILLPRLSNALGNARCKGPFVGAELARAELTYDKLTELLKLWGVSDGN
jgi:hypothetical protein